jgi:osmoprotectant transport system permease protein
MYPQKLLSTLVPLTLYLFSIVGVAPNRIMKAHSVYFSDEILSYHSYVIMLSAIALIMVAWQKRSFLQTSCSYLLSIILMTNLVNYTTQLSTHFLTIQPSASVSFSTSFWLITLISWLNVTTCSRSLGQNYWQRALLNTLYFVPTGIIVSHGALDQLSLMREFEINRPMVYRAAFEHLHILGVTLLITLPAGFLIGTAGFYCKRFGKISLNLLSVIQTVPSIALFAILIHPLSLLVQHVPLVSSLGIRGIGIAPAVIALTSYLLLPMARSTISGMAYSPNETILSAYAMGMSSRQVFWQIRLPLALPSIISGIRVASVQSVGLTMLAALIGAGGFGAIMFLGLSSSALDLILLGVIPVIAFSVLVDTSFKIIIERISPAPPHSQLPTEIIHD